MTFPLPKNPYIFHLFQLHVFRQVLKPKHHKRHLHRMSRAERAVFDELGIMDNAVEKTRLKRNLEVRFEKY